MTRPCHPEAVRRHSRSRPGSRPCRSLTQQRLTVGGPGCSDAGAPWIRSCSETRSPLRPIPPAMGTDYRTHVRQDDTRRSGCKPGIVPWSTIGNPYEGQSHSFGKTGNPTRHATGTRGRHIGDRGSMPAGGMGTPAGMLALCELTQERRPPESRALRQASSSGGTVLRHPRGVKHLPFPGEFRFLLPQSLCQGVRINEARRHPPWTDGLRRRRPAVCWARHPRDAPARARGPEPAGNHTSILRSSPIRAGWPSLRWWNGNAHRFGRKRRASNVERRPLTWRSALGFARRGEARWHGGRQRASLRAYVGHGGCQHEPSRCRKRSPKGVPNRCATTPNDGNGSCGTTVEPASDLHVLCVGLTGFEPLRPLVHRRGLRQIRRRLRTHALTCADSAPRRPDSCSALTAKVGF